MPDRYWVGGTASWDGTAGTKWAATSGGPGGASVPTTADDVFFDANSNTGSPITVTIAAGNTGAKSINCTGFTRTITGSAAITVAGSVTLVAAMTYTYNGDLTLTGTGTLTTAGKSSLATTVTINGAGITVDLGDALSLSGTLNVTQGTFNTNNFNLTCNVLSSNNSNTRTINLGSSTVSLATGGAAVNFTTSTNLTFNAGTSQINVTGTAPSINGGSQVFNNVTFTGVTATASVSSQITGSNTFANLTLSAPSTAAIRALSFTANQIITGTLTCAGATAIRRVYIRSDVTGTARTLTVGTLSANDCDFRDITLAGAAAPASPTRAGDCGGNSGITFPAPKTVYRVGSNTTWEGSSSWALTSGGTGDNNNFPLAQDTAVIDNVASAASISFNTGSTIYNISAVDASLRTNAITFSYTINNEVYGSYTLGSGVTVSGTSSQTFFGRGTTNFTSAGKTISFFILVDAPGGTFRFLDALNSTNGLTLTRGTFDLNNFTITATTFNSSNTNTRTLAFGTGNITTTGSGTAFSALASTGLTVTGTPVVNISNNSATATTVQLGTLDEVNSISFNFTTGTYALTFPSSSGNARNVNFTGFSGTLNNNTRTLFGDLTLSTGMTVASGANVTTFASTSATPRTIITNGKTVDFPLTFNGVGGTFRLLDALTMGSARTLTQTNGTLDLNGFNVTTGSYLTQVGTKNLTFNGGTLTCVAAGTAFNNTNSAGYTTTAGTGTGAIRMTAATAKTFIGGGATYNCTLSNDGAGALTIQSSNTFTTLANGVQPTSFLFTAGTTTTLTNWNISGTAGNLVTIGSPTAASHTLSKASGVVNADYLSISRSNATGGATWNPGTNSVDGGNNTGWLFPGALGTNNFFLFFR